MNELLQAIKAGYPRHWVHNAAHTTDIEALRRICLDHAHWWNNTAIPLLKEHGLIVGGRFSDEEPNA